MIIDAPSKEKVYTEIGIHVYKKNQERRTYIEKLSQREQLMYSILVIKCVVKQEIATNSWFVNKYRKVYEKDNHSIHWTSNDLKQLQTMRREFVDKLILLKLAMYDEKEECFRINISNQ